MKNSIISDINQLNDFFYRQSKLDFMFAFNQFSDEENNNWTQRIKKNYFACGCDTGRNFMFISILLLVTFFIIKATILNQEIHFKLYLYGCIAILAMAIFGKIIGKTTASKKYKKDLSILKSKITDSKGL